MQSSEVFKWYSDKDAVFTSLSWTALRGMLLVYTSSSDFHVLLQIFGEDIKDATVHEDRLVVYHQKGSVFRMYSLYQVIANATITGAKLGQRFTIDEFRGGVVGDPDFGIPVAKIKGKYRFSCVPCRSCSP